MRTVLALMIATSLSFGSFFKEDDKQIHMAITTMASVWGGLIAKKHGATDTQAFWIGFGTAMALGLGKELYDSRDGGTGFDSRDMLANGIGGVAGSTISIIIYEW